jgi:hypothetical protein
MASDDKGPNKGRSRQESLFELPDRTQLAQGFAGRAYVFLRRWGANGNGHAGWGYRVGSVYDCGSMENNSGNPTRLEGETNDAWFIFDVSGAHMQGLMRGGVGPRDLNTERYHDERYPDGFYRVRPAPYQTSPIPITGRLTTHVARQSKFQTRYLGPPVLTDPVEFRRYTEYAWIDVARPNVEAPRRLARASPNVGYGVAGNNCGDLAYNIARAYGVPDANLPLLQVHPQPTRWFEACLREGWTRSAWPLQGSTAAGHELTREDTPTNHGMYNDDGAGIPF